MNFTTNSLLPWYTLLAPLVSAAVITLFSRRAKGLSALISVFAALASFACSCLLFGQTKLSAPEVHWIDISGVLNVPIAFTLDHLSETMLLIVTGVGFLIHVYSLGYMRDDSGKSRYFAGLSLFMFAMIGIVLANNFVMLFIFWELVGFTSYLLIGHWFGRDAAAEAAKKAFLTNRVGDFGFMLGILMIWIATGSVIFDDIDVSKITSHPGYLTATALLLFCGAAGKSAQFPLHVWLPDAMEGPTPVSALIHAATMVAAGVYMMTRIGFIIQASPYALETIAWIGTTTAVLGALMAAQQDDIKRILAYSTLSQLGYMFMALGLASSEGAMFHLFTHAFFKALLFLGAGSIIVMLHHQQNIWRMGGLAKKGAITFFTFAVGALALIGCPPFSGFFSKDAILALAYERSIPIFAVGLLTAFLTAFYVFRLLVVVFFGKSRSDEARSPSDVPFVMTGPLILLAFLSLIGGLPVFAERFLVIPHEKQSLMIVPVVALLALLLGGTCAVWLYRNRTSDPLDVGILRHRFYIDQIYRWLIDSTQELLASVSAFIDRWIIDAVVVRGASGATWGVGAILRLFQVGNLQAYSFLFGLGIVLLIYFTVFR